MEEHRKDYPDIVTHLAVMNEKLDNLIDVVTEVRAQTIKTNGRVNMLELWREGLTSKITIISAVIAMGGSILVAIISRKIWS